MESEIARRRARQQAPSPFFEATIQDPPLNADGWLRVELDNERGDIKEVPWMPRHDVGPQPNDAALVVESDDGNYWAVQWWPQSD